MTSPRERDLHRDHLVTLLTDLLLRALRRSGADGPNGHEHNNRITGGPVGPTRTKVGDDEDYCWGKKQAPLLLGRVERGTNRGRAKMRCVPREQCTSSDDIEVEIEIVWHGGERTRVDFIPYGNIRALAKRLYERGVWPNGIAATLNAYGCVTGIRRRGGPYDARVVIKSLRHLGVSVDLRRRKTELIRALLRDGLSLDQVVEELKARGIEVRPGQPTRENTSITTPTCFAFHAGSAARNDIGFVDHLPEGHLARYQIEGRRSVGRAELSVRHLLRFFRGGPAVQVTAADITRFADLRLRERAKPATVRKCAGSAHFAAASEPGLPHLAWSQGFTLAAWSRGVRSRSANSSSSRPASPN